MRKDSCDNGRTNKGRAEKPENQNRPWLTPAVTAKNAPRLQPAKTKKAPETGGQVWLFR
jgi:hypothetical protein